MLSKLLKGSMIAGAMLLVLVIAGPARPTDYWCCLPDDCSGIAHVPPLPGEPQNPCEIYCDFTMIQWCNGHRYLVTCHGVGNKWTIYYEEEGHLGCISDGSPIVTCASDPDYCEGGPPPGTICATFLTYFITGTC